MSVEHLFSGNPRSLPFHRRYNAEVLAKYAADLRYVVDKMAEGNARPTIPTLQNHFCSEYGIEAASDTIRRHITLLQNGEQLWPSKTS